MTAEKKTSREERLARGSRWRETTTGAFLRSYAAVAAADWAEWTAKKKAP